MLPCTISQWHLLFIAQDVVEASARSKWMKSRKQNKLEYILHHTNKVLYQMGCI